MLKTTPWVPPHLLWVPLFLWLPKGDPLGTLHARDVHGLVLLLVALLLHVRHLRGKTYRQIS